MCGKIIACCISEKKGTVKKNVFNVKIIENYGIENDAHAEKDIIRQVSLISKEKIDDFKKEAGDSVKINDGAFGENIIASGIDFKNIPLKTRFKLGDECILELSQIGKKCHDGCAIKKAVGKCIMPTEGVFCKVIKGGDVKVGDVIEVI